MKRRWICGIYEDRPQRCKDYPTEYDYILKGCGFFFPGDGTRRGECDPECNARCCRMPRVDGDPVGAALPFDAGGEPCKHVVYVDEDGDEEE